MMQERKKALIVDDDEGTREFVMELMHNEGWDTTVGLTGKDALELAEQEEPDLIVLDVDMPEMDGFEAFRRLRTNVLTQRIPIIMLTAINDLDPQGGHDDASMEQRLGVDRPEAFVDKPVCPDDLIKAIMGVVG